MANQSIISLRKINLIKFSIQIKYSYFFSTRQLRFVYPFFIESKSITHSTNIYQQKTTIQQSENRSRDQELNLADESKLKNELMKFAQLKVIKSYKTKLVNETEINLLKINHKHCLLYDENDEFVEKMIRLLIREFNLNRHEAKKYFFKLNLLNKAQFEKFFEKGNNFEYCFKMLKKYFTEDQLLNEFELIRELRPHFCTKLNILKMLGLQLSLHLLKSFTIIMNQKVSTLRKFEILENCPLNSLISQLDLPDELSDEIRFKFNQINDWTIFELLHNVTTHYLQFKTNFKRSKNIKAFSIHNIDLININKVLDFIGQKFGNAANCKENSLIRISRINKFQRIEFNYMALQNLNELNILKMNYNDLILLDDYLKNNDLEFVWQSFFQLSHLFINTSKFIDRLTYLIELKIPRERINKSLYLLITQQGKLDFFITNFGETFFNYPYLRKVFDNYEQIIHKFNELGVEKAKKLPFPDFMNHLKINDKI